MREMTSARQRLKNSPLPKVVLGVALAAGLTMTAAIPANAEVSSSTPSEVVGVERVGGLGTGDGQFNEPNDVAVNDSGQLLVVDNKNHRVQIMDPDGSGSYTYAGQFGNGRGSGVDQFNLPRSIDIAANGDVLIGERNNNRVSIWRPDGTGNYTPFGTFGTRGEGEDQFKAPNDVDVMADGRVAVVDTEHNRLQIWQPDGSGNYVHELTFSDTSASGTALSYPQGITELSDGRLAVTDRDNDRIVLFADDGAGSYAYDSEITGVGTSGGAFRGPYRVMEQSNGNLLISDTGVFAEPARDCDTIDSNNRLVFYTPDGSGGYSYLSEFREMDPGNPYALCGPRGVVERADGTLLVADTGSDYVKMLEARYNIGTRYVDGDMVRVTLPDYANITSESLVAASDAEYDEYVLGNTYQYTFELPVGASEGSSIEVKLFFETDRSPSEVTARFLDSNTNAYRDLQTLAAPTVVAASEAGRDGLLVTYEATDGGALDLDGVANGVIVDPVGLAVNPTDSGGGTTPEETTEPSANPATSGETSQVETIANTGQEASTFGGALAGALLAAIGALLAIRRRVVPQRTRR